MESLRDTYRDDEDSSSNNDSKNSDNNNPTIPTTTTTTTNGVATATIATPDTDIELLDPIKEENLPSEDDDIEISDSEKSPINNNEKSKTLKISDEDEDEDEEEEEEPPPKKQKQLSSLTPAKSKPEKTQTQPKITAANKKGKKKNNNVWTKPTSRKGKKKNNKNTNNNTNSSPNVPPEDKVFITPIPRFPDKNDDSVDMKICLSRVYKAEKVELSDDRMSAGSCKGYRMVRATRGVNEGAWYFEIRVLKLGESGHTRLGWSTEKGDLQAPVGYDGNSFGYRDIDGNKVHKALREKYGDEGYVEGDVIGFYINLPEGKSYTPQPPKIVWYKGQRYFCAADAKDDPPKVVPGELVLICIKGVCLKLYSIAGLWLCSWLPFVCFLLSSDY